MNCKDCKHCVWRDRSWDFTCNLAPIHQDAISGIITYADCRHERSSAGQCGESGKRFQRASWWKRLKLSLSLPMKI